MLKESTKLRKNAYSVPDGYFEGLKASLKMIPLQDAPQRRHSPWKWMVAAVSAAAIAAGGFFLGRYTGDTMNDGYYDSSTYISQMTEDDIIEYLIYSGIEVEEIEEY